MSEHSPIPWEFDDNEHIVDAGGREVVETSHLSCEDIDLILDCVNALAGLKPEAIPKLVAFCERLEKRARYDSSALGRETVGLAELLAEVKGEA
jgi:hypothetical protein